MINRRQLLTALGLGASTAALRPRSLFAGAEGPAPKRLIIVSTGHGTVHQHWHMNHASQPLDQVFQRDLRSLTADEFSRALAPLHGHRERLSIIDGLSMSSTEFDLAGYRHEKGWLHAWTGAWVHFDGSSLQATAPSLDQIVAAQIARPDRLGSLELTVDYGRPVCHAGARQELPLEADPRRAFDRVFGLSRSADPRLQARGSVLDFARAEYQAVAPALSALDRERMDVHYDLVRQLETRLNGLAQAACDQTPERPGGFDGYDSRFRAFTDLIAASFACDMTRVATLSMGDLPSRDFGWGHYLSGDAHNDFAHRIYEDPQAALAMADYTALHASQLAHLIETLSSIPDSDGGSLMDNTLIVWGGELGDGWHGFHHYPTVMAGGSWHFRTGRYVHYPDDGTPLPILTPEGTRPTSGMPHQHALVSVAQAMGVDTDFIGLAELETNAGVRVDLRGPLSELT